jgi:hypothetical protein
MRRNIVLASVIGAALLGSGVAQSVVSDADRIEYDRRLAQTHKTVFPKSGVVPDAETAEAIALAIAIPVWGKKTVESELPLLAELEGNVWTVIGKSPSRGVGGELIIQLDKRNGAVLSLLHTQ